MTRPSAALAFVAAVAFAAPAASVAAATSVPTTNAAGPHAHASACTKAVVGGKSICLASGKMCARRYESKYKKKGFTCKKSGKRYQLVKLKLAF